MPDYKYMQLPLQLISNEIIKQYNLVELASKETVYIDIRKGIPGLK